VHQAILKLLGRILACLVREARTIEITALYKVALELKCGDGVTKRRRRSFYDDMVAIGMQHEDPTRDGQRRRENILGIQGGETLTVVHGNI
jgi:hypothetical protein